MSELRGLDRTLELEYLEVSAAKVVARWTVGPEHRQPFGIAHGGFYCAEHGSTASIGSQMWLQERGIAPGVNIKPDFLRQADEGEDVNATAVPIHQGRKQQLSDGVRST